MDRAKKDTMCIVYVVGQDISMGNGAGVNEREFIQTLGRMPDTILKCYAPGASRLDNIPRAVRAVTTFVSLPILLQKIRFPPLYHLVYQIGLFHHLVRTVKPIRRLSIVVQRPSAFPIAPLVVAKLFHLPYALRVRGDILDNLSQKRAPIVVKRLMLAIVDTLQRLNFASADRLFVVTETLARRIHESYGVQKDRIVVSPNGVNLERFKPQVLTSERRGELGLGHIPTGAFVFGYVGLVAADKAMEEMLQAANLALQFKNHPICLHFIIIGVGPLLQKIRHMAACMSIEKHITFLGQRSYDLMPAYINCFDVGLAVFSSRWIKQVGSSALKLSQYLACGRPVLATVAPDHEFIQREGLGKLVHPEDIPAYADALISMSRLNKSQKHEISRRATRYARRHMSQESLAADLLMHSRSLLTSFRAGDHDVSSDSSPIDPWQTSMVCERRYSKPEPR